MTNTVKIVSIIIVIITIVILNFIVGRYTDKVMDHMEAGIDELKQSLLDGKYEESIKQSEKLRDEWKSYEDNFGYFMDHEEIEKLSVKVAVIAENARNKEYELALEDSIETRFLLEHVKDKLKMKLSNVF